MIVAEEMKDLLLEAWETEEQLRLEREAKVGMTARELAECALFC